MGEKTMEAVLKEVKEDEVILREGEENFNIYKILTGKAIVYSDYGTESETIIRVLSPGSYFGEMGLLVHEPSLYTVVMYCDGVLFTVTEARFEHFVQNNYHDVLGIMRSMAGFMMNFRKSLDLQMHEIEAILEECMDKEELIEFQKRLHIDKLVKELVKYNMRVSPAEEFVRDDP